MSSITEVAKKAGVSISTVSHVIHGTKNVSEDLVRKVEATIEELDFQINDMAGSIKRKTTKNIGIILPKITMLFFPDVLEGIEQAAKEHGYKLFYVSTDYNFKEEKESVKLFKSSWVDGIILDSCCEKDHMPEYAKLLEANHSKKKVPVVTLECSFNSEVIGSVGIDHIKYTTKAVEYLLSIGHREIALLVGPEYLPLCADNLKGYKTALEAASVPFNGDYVLEGNYLPVSGYHSVKSALRKGINWTAIFVANDQMAIGAVKALKEAGLRIPQDVAVMGFDNVFPGTLTEPSLTTVHVPRYKMGYDAAQLLIDKIENRPITCNHIKLDGNIIVRQSTDETIKIDWDLTGW